MPDLSIARPPLLSFADAMAAGYHEWLGRLGPFTAFVDAGNIVASTDLGETWEYASPLPYGAMLAAAVVAGHQGDLIHMISRGNTIKVVPPTLSSLYMVPAADEQSAQTIPAIIMDKHSLLLWATPALAALLEEAWEREERLTLDDLRGIMDAPPALDNGWRQHVPLRLHPHWQDFSDETRLALFLAAYTAWDVDRREA